MNNNVCKICNIENNTEEYKLREMMFGLPEEFEYFKCNNCGCLQIKQFPENIVKYYPSDYLCFPKIKRSFLKEYLMKKREMSVLSNQGKLGKLLKILFGFSDLNLLWFLEADINKNDSILEVGCGRGDLLFKLMEAGFKNLIGIDPLIEKDRIFNKNFKILKKDLNQINDLKFTWVMFHHSFEHLNNPVETFKILEKIIVPGGNILIRIPIIDSNAWDIYKTNWVQLDPPRHYFLHTVKSIEYLTNKFNFKINKIIYDSTAFQFLGSEQCKRQIPLMNPKSYFINPNNSIFKKTDIVLYNKKAKELNKNKRGDTACFFIKKLV